MGDIKIAAFVINRKIMSATNENIIIYMRISRNSFLRGKVNFQGSFAVAAVTFFLGGGLVKRTANFPFPPLCDGLDL